MHIGKGLFTPVAIGVGVTDPDIDVESQYRLVAQEKVHSAYQQILHAPVIQGCQDRIDVHAPRLAHRLDQASLLSHLSRCLRGEILILVFGFRLCRVRGELVCLSVCLDDALMHC